MRRSTIKYAATAIVVGTCLFAASTTVSAQGLSDNLSVHGFLTQGYATSSDLPIYGIPTDGTVDYRSAALQFRYALSASDNVVLQMRSRQEVCKRASGGGPIG
jgi:hypothetical protein